MMRRSHEDDSVMISGSNLVFRRAMLGALGLSLAITACSSADEGSSNENLGTLTGGAGVGGASASVTGIGSGVTTSTAVSNTGASSTGVAGTRSASIGSSSGGTGAGTTSTGVTTTGGGTASVSSGGGGTAGETATTGSGTTGEPPIDDRSEEGTCLRWNADHENMDEGTWSGDVATCDPGDISADGRANALRLYNLYRWLADLPPVETSDERNSLAQACALIMEANNDISHTPDMDWECWTQEGADGAESSNITTGPSVGSVAGYMLDPGNETTLGHRRWILSNSLGPIGIGSTGQGASCMQNLGGEGRAGKEWTAWPPPGAFPIQAYSGGFGVTLNDTGWSLQSDSIDLGDATVAVTSESETLSVSVVQLGGGYGSRYAIRFNPEGWEPEAGTTYSVAVGGVDPAISYDVQFVDCE